MTWLNWRAVLMSRWHLRAVAAAWALTTILVVFDVGREFERRAEQPATATAAKADKFEPMIVRVRP